jgi:glycosyltransferase involved in cell wall biosynthesis
MDGVHVLRAPMLLHMSSQPVGWRYFLWCLREGRAAKLVHLHAPNILATLAVGLLGRKPKLVVHWHSDVVGKGWLGRALAPLEAALLRRADSILCTSQAYADASLRLRPFAQKTKIVPIGMPDADSSFKEWAALPDALETRLVGRRLVLAIGRLVPYKGFHVLVEAARKLPPEAVVLIVGTGPLYSALQVQIDAAALRDKVVLAGRQSDAVLRSLFQRAELFCLPSVERSEAFGVVLVEAMSHGLPIVATQIPGSGVPWVNADGISGFNVPVGDAQSLADACNKILASVDLRACLSSGARKRYEMEFTEKVSLDRMLRVYEQLLATD